MEVNVNIDPEQINKMVSEAILKSTLGNALETAIKKEMASLTGNYNNPLDYTIKQHVSDIVKNILATEYKPKITESLTKALSTKMTDEYIDKICNKIASKYDD